ncbi:MAG TPA: ABC transporter substrate-binding protein [Candidatus Sulfomarinibacteraceae bacterium]|nr:ABC transporter substrate-binding protein [Candidatus Sulfomarinibacteraceae bacterium]
MAQSGDIDCMGAAPGDEVTMLYQWAGVEEENLNRVLQPLIDACGITLSPESSRDQGLLDTRVQAGTPPDIVFWTFRQAQQYQDVLVPMTDLGVHEENYADFWREAGTLGGEWLALPVKADPKTLVWYSPVNFEAFGYEVPATWEELEDLVEQMVADGNVPWSMGLESGDATGWTGSDFIQDILQVKQGPDYVRGIIDGTVPYDDAGVRNAYELYGAWAADPAYTVGGAQGTLSTAFLDAIYKVFSDPPEAMMVEQSGFAGGAIAEQFPELTYGVDYDFFKVPGADSLQGGTSWMMAFSDEPAAQALVAYLSSDAGGVKWAEVGFDLTPNSAGTDAYTDPALLKKAEMLAETEDFVPDLGDSIPSGFGNAEWTAIINFLNGESLDVVLPRAAEVQADATQ